MSTVALQTTALADSILKEIGIMQNPYFDALKNGQMSKEAFRKSQEQFYFAVAYFSRPMTTLIARMDDPLSRLDILHNVVEEHGDFDEKKFHKTTFEKFLQLMGSSPQRSLHAESSVRAFNTALMGICHSEPVEMGIAANGIIEYAFADISALIGNSAIARGFIEKKQLVHYNMHADLDKEHAQEFFMLLEKDMSHPEKRALIEAGLQLGAYLFNRLYLDLCIKP